MINQSQTTNLAQRVIKTFFTAKGYPQLQRLIRNRELGLLHDSLLVLSDQFPESCKDTNQAKERAASTLETMLGRASEIGEAAQVQNNLGTVLEKPQAVELDEVRNARLAAETILARFGLNPYGPYHE